MSASGAKVLMLRSVELARNHGVRIHARSTFSDEEGTWVQEGASMEQPIVSAVTHSENDVVFTLSDIPDRPGVAALIFDVVGSAHVNVDTIIQNVVHGNAEMSFSVPAEDVPATQARAREHPRRARRLHDRGEPRPRQGVADRGRHAVASGRRGQDVPHARRQRDQPADDLDLADQDLLHDRPLGDPERRARAPRGVRARERADPRRRRDAGKALPARRRITRTMEISTPSDAGDHHRRDRILVVIAVRVMLDFVVQPLRTAPAAARPAGRRASPNDVQLRPPGDRRARRDDRDLGRAVALRHHRRDRQGAARLERRARAVRRAGVQHAALEPRLGPARRLHAAAAPRRPHHGRRRDRIRRGDGPDLHDARHRRRPARLHPEHAADDEHDRQPHDQGPTAARRGPLPRLDRDADRRGAGGAARRDRRRCRARAARAPASSWARSTTARSGSRRRRTGRSTPTSSRSRASCASSGSARSARPASSLRNASGCSINRGVLPASGDTPTSSDLPLAPIYRLRARRQQHLVDHVDDAVRGNDVGLRRRASSR